MLILTLPWVLSVNGYYRVVGKSLKISKEGRANRKLIMATVYDQLGGYPEPLIGELSVTVKVYPPDKRKRDLDNIFKGLFDSLTHAKVWADDSLVKHIDASMLEIVKKGRVVVEINELISTPYFYE